MSETNVSLSGQARRHRKQHVSFFLAVFSLIAGRDKCHTCTFQRYKIDVSFCLVPNTPRNSDYGPKRASFSLCRAANFRMGVYPNYMDRESSYLATIAQDTLLRTRTASLSHPSRNYGLIVQGVFVDRWMVHVGLVLVSYPVWGSFSRFQSVEMLHPDLASGPLFAETVM